MKIRTTVFFLPILLILFTANTLLAARTELISRSPSGEPGNGTSERPAISDDARYIVFQSTAQNLVIDKTSSRSDIFLYDRNTKKTTRINLAADNSEANASSEHAAISADGSIIAFASDASNLVGGDTQGNKDIFIYDRTNGTITRVSVDSADTPGNDDSDFPDVSEDGRYVVFESEATNLVSNDTNEQSDIFRHDRQTGTTIRVNLDFLNDEATSYDSNEPKISDNGRYVVFRTYAALTPCDDNNTSDVFYRDLVENTTILASVTYYGCVANNRSVHPSISGDGRFVSFSSYASNLIIEDDTNSREDLYLRDFQNEITERISVSSSNQEGDQRSVGYGGNISQDGRYVVFSSQATNMVESDTNDQYDVFARDRTKNKTTRESVSHYWEEGYSSSSSTNTAVISANGRYIVFDSNLNGLVPGDTSSTWDIFVRDYLWPGPLVTDISPKSGDFHGGTVLTIIGSNFASNVAVTIDGIVPSNLGVNSAGTMITCITPAHATGSVQIRVTNPDDGYSWLYPVGRGFSGYLYRPLAFPFLGILLLSK